MVVSQTVLPVRASNAIRCASLVATKSLSSYMLMPRIAAPLALLPYRFSQISSPVFPSIACSTLPGLLRKMTPLWTSGAGWLAPPSFIAQIHCRRRSFTLSAVI